jgi:hypothetical protein
MKISKFCIYFIQISPNVNDTTAILRTTLLIMTMLKTHNTGIFAYNDITYS